MTQFVVGAVEVDVADTPSIYRGKASRDGAEEDGIAYTAELRTPDGFGGTAAVIEWSSGPVDLRLVDFAAGADAYRRLERAGTMSIDVTGENWSGIVRALKHGDKDYPTLHQVTRADLDWLLGDDAEALLLGAGVTELGPRGDLLPGSSARFANSLATLSPVGDAKPFFVLYALTRVLPIMKNFGLSLPEALI